MMVYNSICSKTEHFWTGIFNSVIARMKCVFKKFVNWKCAIREFHFLILIWVMIFSIADLYTWWIWLFVQQFVFIQNICHWRDQEDKYALYNSSAVAYICQLFVSVDQKPFCRTFLSIEFFALCRYNVSVFALKTETTAKFVQRKCFCFVQIQRFFALISIKKLGCNKMDKRRCLWNSF